MKDKVVLITAGPTKEYIDPVRYISNDSSGKMGYILAEESKRIGKVILVSGPTKIKPPKKVKFIKVISALEMYYQVKKYLKKCDIFISCAAVCDFRVKNASKYKIKKSNKSIKLELIPNHDILMEASCSKNGKDKIMVGFALETNNLINNAIWKLKKKKLDIIIANIASALNNDKSTGAIITKYKIESFNNLSKQILAKRIIGKILKSNKKGD